MNKKNKVLKLSLNEELLLLQSLSYRIEYYKDKLVQQPEDKLYKKCLKDLKSLEKTFENDLLGTTGVQRYEVNAYGKRMHRETL